MKGGWEEEDGGELTGEDGRESSWHDRELGDRVTDQHGRLMLGEREGHVVLGMGGERVRGRRWLSESSPGGGPGLQGRRSSPLPPRVSPSDPTLVCGSSADAVNALADNSDSCHLS